MLEEEEDVDIEGMIPGLEDRVGDRPRQNGENDEDTLWALDDPDDDIKGWKLEVLIEEDKENEMMM